MIDALMRNVIHKNNPEIAKKVSDSKNIRSRKSSEHSSKSPHLVNLETFSSAEDRGHE